MPVRLKQLREDKNTSQEDIAAAAGVSQGTWSTWEKETPKQFEALARVARKYRISANYLLGLSDDPTLILNTAPNARMNTPPPQQALRYDHVLDCAECRAAGQPPPVWSITGGFSPLESSG